MTDDDFYARCEAILDARHEGVKPVRSYITRWNNRSAGRGRFPGRGVVRLFGDQVQIALRAPVAITTSIDGREAALELLERRVAPTRHHHDITDQGE